MLDRDYRPLHDPTGEPVRPLYPTRVKAFVLACGRVAAIKGGLMEDRPAR